MTKNIDVRSKAEEPLVPFNARKAKPGRDYFTGNFFSLLAIAFYTLFFFKNITGYIPSNQAGAVSLQLNHFTSYQVLALFGLFSLMLVERMLYRSRKYNW